MNSPFLSSTMRLLVASQDGDRKALDALFERCLPRVRRIVSLRIGTRLRSLYDRDDLVQGAMLRAFRGLSGFKEQSPAMFQNWLARCVESELVDTYRAEHAKKRRGETEVALRTEDVMLSSIIDSRMPTPSWLARARELEERVEAALLKMPKHHREAIILRHLCGYSYEEIADAMGFEREVNARMAVSRAVKRLREWLDRESSD